MRGNARARCACFVEVDACICRLQQSTAHAAPRLGALARVTRGPRSVVSRPYAIRRHETRATRARSQMSDARPRGLRTACSLAGCCVSTHTGRIFSLRTTMGPRQSEPRRTTLVALYSMYSCTTISISLQYPFGTSEILDSVKSQLIR